MVETHSVLPYTFVVFSTALRWKWLKKHQLSCCELSPFLSNLLKHPPKRVNSRRAITELQSDAFSSSGAATSTICLMISGRSRERQPTISPRKMGCCPRDFKTKIGLRESTGRLTSLLSCLRRCFVCFGRKSRRNSKAPKVRAHKHKCLLLK
jgi:hypothetical protein